MVCDDDDDDDDDGDDGDGGDDDALLSDLRALQGRCRTARS